MQLLWRTDPFKKFGMAASVSIIHPFTKICSSIKYHNIHRVHVGLHDSNVMFHIGLCQLFFRHDGASSKKCFFIVLSLSYSKIVIIRTFSRQIFTTWLHKIGSYAVLPSNIEIVFYHLSYHRLP